jgi:hypothetical protein
MAIDHVSMAIDHAKKIPRMEVIHPRDFDCSIRSG